MTKKIRVENADTATFGVIVEVWDKYSDGRPDALFREIKLPFPASMTTEDLYITSMRYLVVKEAPSLG